MSRLKPNSQFLNERPDIVLTKGSSFGQAINAIFKQDAVAESLHCLFTDVVCIPNGFIEKVAESDTELFLSNAFECPLTERQSDGYIQSISRLNEYIQPLAGQFMNDVYFDSVRYEHNSLQYLASHPFVRKAIMEAVAAYLRCFFPFEVQINIESGHKKKGNAGFYISQKRDKVGIYRSDWFYMPVPEIRDYIGATVQHHTRLLPDNRFCNVVKSAGVGTVDLVEYRTHSSVYRFCETNMVSQQFDNGCSRCFEGLTEYKATKQADQLIERFKCNAVKMSLKMDNSKLICKYLAPPYADVQVVLSGNGFTLYPICWYQDADAETKARILSYINKKLTKYGRTLPFQKKLTYEPKN